MKLHDVIAQSKHLSDRMNAAEVYDLWGKLKRCQKQGVLDTFEAMRRMAHVDEQLDEPEARALEQYAAQHRKMLPADVEVRAAPAA